MAVQQQKRKTYGFVTRNNMQTGQEIVAEEPERKTRQPNLFNAIKLTLNTNKINC